MGTPVSIALVNNMPDGAFVDTELQFRRVLAAGGYTGSRALALYTMSGLHRSHAVMAEIRSRYLALDKLYDDPPDRLIVTGTEPAQAQLSYEAYWPHLSQVLQWAADNVPVTLLSCLAAHASLLIFDGIERQPLPQKCSGVFEGRVATGDERLAQSLPRIVPIPHSRLNDIPEAAMTDAGYRLVIGGGANGSGWSVAARRQGFGTFVLCQGHPEYSTESLLREYRRDVRRHLFGHGAIEYPQEPEGYFSAEGTRLLEAFRERASACVEDPLALYEAFPYAQLASGLRNRWGEASAAFYRNWLDLALDPRRVAV